ncbi:MAG: NADH-quinone oxidoreductase subunit L [Elusimicrobia bacterium]|nr:NADH-quinone oxidoreductase subunit L [Elusimicrobiota bacterium]
MISRAWLIPILPLAASLVILFFGREREDSPLPFVGIAAIGASLWIALRILFDVALGTLALPYENDWSWFSFAADLKGHPFILDMRAGVLVDGAAAAMLAVVCLVSLLVQVYSLGYMRGDAKFKRYFAYMSFFTASMLGLVVSNNLLVTFGCWELVGVSSYLLIGFWFEREAPAYAAKKAFITTKLGDLGFFLALLLTFLYAGSFNIVRVKDVVEMGYMPPFVVTLIGLGLLSGAAGKSAQAPLFIWLPDAMEGPTPVSALIHAATMVAAGIYLVARCYFVFAASPLAMETVAWAGLVTAFLAATMALVPYDIKRVLAFSTVSQLGFMMCALGVGGYTAGLFHLTTHAFFKALLFLCAGSVIHAVHTNDMRSMGGLSKRMPLTFLTMVVGAAAISGIPPLAGFYSKDLILEKVFEHSPAMFGVLALTACLTAFYTFRMLFLTFWGDGRNNERVSRAEESQAVMTIPLLILAALSLVSGWALEHAWAASPGAAGPGAFASLVGPGVAAAEHGATGAARHVNPTVLAASVTAGACCFIALAYSLYCGPDLGAAERLKARFLPVFKLLENRWGFDAFFLALVDIADRVADLAKWVDTEVIDKVFVDGWGVLTRIAAEISHLFDALFVDQAVDGCGYLSRDWVGAGLRGLIARGQVQEYLLYLAVGVSLFAIMK